MIAWLAMGIPVLTVIVLLVFFRRKTVVWEFLIPFVASVILIFLGKSIVEKLQVKDNEFWGGPAEYAEFYERWDEEVPCVHEISCTHEIPCSHRDSNGNAVHSNDGYMHSNDGYYHPYDVDDHPPEWYVHDSNGIRLSTSSAKFEHLAELFKSRQKVDLQRDYHSIDGDKYVATWPRTDETLEPVTTEHSYENRVAASDSVMNYPKVTEEEVAQYGLYDYPKITDYYYLPSILGNGGPSTQEAEKLLGMWNAKLGGPKQVRMWILIFNGGDIATGQMQEAFWKGANKNEFVITIGLDGQGNTAWTYVFSWSESERLKIETRNFVIEDQGKPLDLVKIVNWLAPAVNDQFVRREFAEFDYLEVTPPGWALALIFIVTFLVNVGCTLWIIMNEFEENLTGSIRQLWNGRRKFNWPREYSGYSGDN
jgi:hypothetical protein